AKRTTRVSWLSYSLLTGCISFSGVATDPIYAQQQTGLLVGKVTDEKGHAQTNATIRIIETGAVSHTDENGDFRLSLSPGNYTIRVNHLSFSPLSRSVSVKSGETTRL